MFQLETYSDFERLDSLWIQGPSRQPKVCQLDVASSVNQKVLWQL